MPLSNNNLYGVKPLTEAINNLPAPPTIIRESKLFTNEFLTTTHVNVESKNGELSLIQAVPRGANGLPVNQNRGIPRSFNMVHLPKKDVVYADDVQNLRTFGTDNKTEAVANVLLDKAEAMKSDIIYSEEHLLLGALQGKILNADGSVIYDLYREFGVARSSYTLNLSNADTEVGKEIDDLLLKQEKQLGNQMKTGWICYCSAEFLQALEYHPKVKELYTRFADGVKVYRDGLEVKFSYRGIDFVTYTHHFGTDADIKAGEAHLVPTGTKLFKMYYAPANTNSAVNTKALAYYLSRHELPHGVGWELYAQSNPLPLVLKPKICATLKMA